MQYCVALVIAMLIRALTKPHTSEYSRPEFWEIMDAIRAKTFFPSLPTTPQVETTKGEK